jgi:hypothetical protein
MKLNFIVPNMELVPIRAAAAAVNGRKKRVFQADDHTKRSSRCDLLEAAPPISSSKAGHRET